jgi:uncharacterized protein
MKNIAVSIVAGLAFVLGIGLVTNSWDKRLESANTIDVTGLTKVDFTSDLIVWRGTFSKKAMSLKDAYAALKNDESIIKSYLIGKGISKESLIISSVRINQDYEYRYDQNGNSNRVFNGYNLTQEVKIESENVALVETISREVTELIDKGVEFYSYQPEYYYSKLSDLKIEMIASATADARTRAEQIAQNAKAEVGDLVSADLGVFQITGQNSNEEFTWGGVYNTQEKNKTARVTMRLKFGIE